MSYLQFCAGDISPRSFAFGRAFHYPPKLPFSWFARVIVRARAITHVSSKGLTFVTNEISKNKYDYLELKNQHRYWFYICYINKLVQESLDNSSIFYYDAELVKNVITFEPLLAGNKTIFFYFEVFIMYIPFLMLPNSIVFLHLLFPSILMATVNIII